MPIYEYKCGRCGRVTEVLQGVNAKTSPRCSECDVPMERLISPTSFILKGSGWYVTDYPSSSRKKGMEAEKKSRQKKEKSPTEKSTPAKSKKTKKAKTSPGT